MSVTKLTAVLLSLDPRARAVVATGTLILDVLDWPGLQDRAIDVWSPGSNVVAETIISESTAYVPLGSLVIGLSGNGTATMHDLCVHLTAAEWVCHVDQLGRLIVSGLLFSLDASRVAAASDEATLPFDRTEEDFSG